MTQAPLAAGQHVLPAFLCPSCGGPISAMRRANGAHLCGACEEKETAKDMAFLRELRQHAEKAYRDRLAAARGGRSAAETQN
jgi:hypothetical protein